MPSISLLRPSAPRSISSSVSPRVASASSAWRSRSRRRAFVFSAFSCVLYLDSSAILSSNLRRSSAASAPSPPALDVDRLRLRLTEPLRSRVILTALDLASAASFNAASLSSLNFMVSLASAKAPSRSDRAVSRSVNALLNWVIVSLWSARCRSASLTEDARSACNLFAFRDASSSCARAKSRSLMAAALAPPDLPKCASASASFASTTFLPSVTVFSFCATSLVCCFNLSTSASARSSLSLAIEDTFENLELFKEARDRSEALDCIESCKLRFCSSLISSNCASSARRLSASDWYSSTSRRNPSSSDSFSSVSLLSASSFSSWTSFKIAMAASPSSRRALTRPFSRSTSVANTLFSSSSSCCARCASDSWSSSAVDSCRRSAACDLLPACSANNSRSSCFTFSASISLSLCVRFSLSASAFSFASFDSNCSWNSAKDWSSWSSNEAESCLSSRTSA